MFSARCAEGAVDNSAASHCYYVRLPAACAGEFAAGSVEREGETARLITEPMSVQAMHETAARLRASGVSLFFAAIAQ